MSISFSSSIHSITPNLYIGGEQLAAFEIEEPDTQGLYVNVQTAQAVISNDNDLFFAARDAGPRTYIADIAALYTQLKTAGMVEVVHNRLLLNPTCFSVIKIGDNQITIDIEGAEKPVIFKKDSEATASVKEAGYWALPQTAYEDMVAQVPTFRESTDMSLEDLQTQVATLTAQVEALQEGVVALNAGLASGTLQANTLQVG